MRAFYEKELRPFLAGVPAEAAWVLVAGTALLVAKRELTGLGGWGWGQENLPWVILAWLWLAVLVGVMLFLEWERRRRHGDTEILEQKGKEGTEGIEEATGQLGNWATGQLGNQPHLSEPNFLISQFPSATLGTSGAGWAVIAVALVMLLLTGSGARRMGFWETLLQLHYAKVSWLLASAAWLGPLPFILVLTVLRGRPTDYGWGLGRWRMWGPVWAILTVFMLAVIFLASRWTDFSRYYPMYKATYPDYSPQADGWGFFLQYELAYGLYFLAWEFFFRSFMLFGLERCWGGPSAILIQMVPFTLMHIGKPTPEFFSALIAGLALGWLAWRGRSFWPCFLLHWTCAGAMDVFAAFVPG